ncbi:hypothetical protein BJ878DRAFT_542014 [Calycina marina]|uniref:Uncharacterized protein n=1 Tax=Calycina marina TaxID=1763456 RepID=A0A9P8CF22_9HELO|nr:hypothetical protein BJ878DRAFT_542014 [Calycina marina]
MHIVSSGAALEALEALLLQIPATDTLRTLRIVVERRLDANRILMEREKKALSGEDYRVLEVNLDSKPYLRPEVSGNTRRLEGMAHSHRQAELFKGKDNVVPPSDMCNIPVQEAEVCQSVLAIIKMLFRRMNDGCLVNGDDASEVIKYIDTILKVDFDLDSTSKPKPVVGPDDPLLLLVQHWARDQFVFPTEDDRHDLATIMLFNAYIGGRPAEFFHASKGKAGQRGFDDKSNASDDSEDDENELFDDGDQDACGNHGLSDGHTDVEVSTVSRYYAEETDDPTSK